MGDKKILVISHSALSKNSSNGRTLAALLNMWDKSNVANIYINDEDHDVNLSDNFFPIKDKWLIYKLNPFEKQKKINHNRKKTKDLNHSINKNETTFLLRSLLWSTGVWKTKELINWFNRFAPDVILFNASNYIFLHSILLFLNRVRKTPIIIYNSEDYYIKVPKYNNVFMRYYWSRYKKIVQKTIDNTALFIHGNDLLTNSFKKEFNVDHITIMNTSNLFEGLNQEFNFQKTRGGLRLLYAGNLHSWGRDKALLELSKSIKQINKSLFIDVYSSSDTEVIRRNYNISNGIVFHGSVNYNELEGIMAKSDVLIHIESFEEKYSKKIMYGFTTKIADMLKSRKSLLIYGPPEIATISYFKNNKLGFVIENNDHLLDDLRLFLLSDKTRTNYIENAIRFSNERHSFINNGELFYDIVLRIVKEGGRINI